LDENPNPRPSVLLGVFSNVLLVNHLPEYSHRVWVGYIIYFHFFFSKSIDLNQMHIQGYIHLEKYTHFINLDVSQKYHT
jgi:hypothetical protein